MMNPSLEKSGLTPTVLLVFAACLLVLTGCGGFDKKPIRIHQYDLIISHTEKNANLAEKGHRLLVKELQIAAAFDSHQFIYRISPDRYVNDYYNEFIQYPARLITERLSNALGRTQFFSTRVTQDISRPDYRLSGKINKLYADRQDKARHQAIMEITLILEKKGENAFLPLISKTYGQEIELETTSPVELSRKWGKALEIILDQLVSDVSDASE